jgi:hypothetical protein
MTEMTPEAVKATLDAATPGPWFVQNDHRLPRYGVVLDRRGKSICDTRFENGVPSRDLIAMAPDLATAYLALRAANGKGRALLVRLHAEGKITASVCEALLNAYRATEERG